MSEEKKPEGQTEEGATQETKTENTQVDEVQAKIDAAIEKVADSFKGEIAGLNRKNSEMQETLRQKSLEGKTEEEKHEVLKVENKRIEDENLKLIRDRFVDTHLNSAGLPLKFAKRIIGEDDANIEKDVSDFSSYIKEIAQGIADKIVNERLGGKGLKEGDPPIGKTMTNEQFMLLNAKARALYMKDGGKISA